jgi:KDO2-lipid IV(A) lauroyltransferase
MSIFRALRRGDLLAALIDQDTKVPSVFVPFFGRPAKTPSGPAMLALKRRTPVIAGFITRTPHGHRIKIVRISTEGFEGEAGVTALTARMTAAIEQAIRAAPEQWVWFHRRWRSQPDAPALAERNPT